jgi:hypothetical protein
MDHEDSSSLGVNDAGTYGQVDTRLTRACSPDVLRRQLLHLSSVYQSSPGYYREALRPVIRTLLDRLEART